VPAGQVSVSFGVGGKVVVTQFDAEAITLGAAITPGPRLVVIGSTSFWGHDSCQLCEAIAADLAGVAVLVALTGGMDGVGLTFGRTLAAARRAAGQPENLFHLLPRGMGPCDSGVTLGAGIDYHDRREVLGRVGHAYLVIEGGPGTEHEAAVAAGRGAPVIPLGRTGGHAGELHRWASCPPGFPRADWDLLADVSVPLKQVVAAVGRLVWLSLARHAEPSAAPDPGGIMSFLNLRLFRRRSR
jgi:hypothetical protein